MNKSKVSVIVPVYNSASYLRECLDSVTKQTYKNIEIICIDDGSTDGSAYILKDYLRKDDRFKLIQQTNHGPGSARNTGIDRATGDYIFFVDSDDIIHSKALERFVFLAEKTDADVICGQFISLNSAKDKKESNLNTPYRVENNPLSLFTTRKVATPISVWNKLFKRNVFKERRFIPEIYYEDFPLIFSVFSDIKSCVLTDCASYFYRRNNVSIMRSPPSIKKANDYTTAITFVYKEFRKRKRTKELNLIFKNYISRMHSFVLLSIKNNPEYSEYLDYLHKKLSFFEKQGLIPYQKENSLNSLNVADIVLSLKGKTK